MKKKWLVPAIVGFIVLVAGIIIAAVLLSTGGLKVVLDGELSAGSVIEYTGEKVQLPVAHVEDRAGNIVSYDVNYRVTSLDTDKVIEDKYATFDLKVGEYKIDYIYGKKKSVNKTIKFSVEDTTAPEITFSDIPNGLFLQDINLEDSQKLPSYIIADASELDGMEIERTLYFKGESDSDYQECSFREINNSYDVTDFGKFKYIVTATDAYGNENTQEAEWKIKDREWKPSELPQDGYLADYSSEGYTNLVEGGDANQYYKIGNDYSDEWLEEYEGAEGVLKVDMGFNNAAGYGNNTLKLRFARSFTKKDIVGKYLAVRMYIEAEHVKDELQFAGVNVAIREDGINRAFTSIITGIETGKWVTYYIDADLVEHIGMYPNAKYNSATTFYEGGDAATALQLCFQRISGYSDRMVLYVDSITLAEKLSDTAIAISGKTASWDAVKGAAGYKVNLNGEETIITETSIQLDGSKGYIRVTPLGDGALTLDGEEITAAYGLDAGNKLAAFDDELYIHLFSDKLKFSTSNEHIGYKPSSMTGTKTSEGVTLELGASSWGVCNGVRLQFPKEKAKGNNTAVRITMSISDSKYRVMRVYDYDGQLLQSIDLNSSNTGKYYNFDVDLATYDKKLAGLQFIFGPSEGMVNVPEGVTLKFKSIEFVNNYYNITVDGQKLSCAGERTLTPGYTQKNLVQFTSVYNFGVPADDTPLSFSGTVLLDGKEVQNVSVVGYPETDTICFKLLHDGKVLTIKEGSVIYYNGTAIEIGETFNAKWNGTEWVAVAKIPSAPEKEYVTIQGTKYEVVDSVSLNAGFTTSDLVQFTDFYDFGAPQEDTPLYFEGTVLLDGKEVNNVQIVGYKNNTTITLRVAHNGKVLTVLAGSYVYYEGQAVKVKETFNAKWDGTSWHAVADIPTPAEKEYVTIGGEQKEIVDKIILSAGYTADSLVQFTNVYDFGLSEQGSLEFSGTVLLDGVEQTSVDIQGYPSNTTICLQGISHKNKVLTIMKDSVIYLGDKAIVVKETFNAKWDGTSWNAVADIPTPAEKEYVTIDGEQKELVDTVILREGYATGVLVQFANIYDFGVPTDNTQLTFSGDILVDGTPADVFEVIGYTNNKTICFNILHGDRVLTIKEGSYIYYGDKAVKIGETFNKKYSILANNWTPVAEIPTPPSDEEQVLTLEYRWGAGNVIQFNTNLPSTTPCANFLVTDNGCDIDQSGNQYQQVGWIGMTDADGTIVLTFNFGGNFEAGQTYMLPEGAVFGFTDGNKYVLDKDYIVKFNGSEWSIQEELPALELTYRWGAGNVIQFNTNLPSTTPCANFLTTDNGCDIDQSGNQYQQVGWIGMADADGTIVLTFNFGSSFTAGQTYVLPEGAVFGFTDGNKYVLDKEYTVVFDGSEWSIQEPLPVLELTYRWGAGNVIQFNTNLPSTTPCVNFLTTDNGCDIDQSGNQYQQVGWIGMADADGTIVLTFNFGSSFTAGQTYVLPQGAVFGFTDGNKYQLDKGYTVTYNGTDWIQTN